MGNMQAGGVAKYVIDLENHKNKTINPILGHKYSTCPSGRSFKGY